jgi:hypothetical protein
MFKIILKLRFKPENEAMHKIILNLRLMLENEAYMYKIIMKLRLLRLCMRFRRIRSF